MWNRFTRKILVERLKESQRKNSAFSLRAFALKAKISPGALSEFISGKRRLSKESAIKVVENLELSPAERKQFDRLLNGDDVRDELKDDKFSLISHWSYFAVLSILELDNPPTDVKEIAKRLALPVEKVKEIAARLVALDLLHERAGKLELTGRHFVSTDEIPSKAIVQSHMEDLDLAKTSLRSTPVGERDFVSLTFAGSSEDLKKAKREIRRFRDRLYTIMSASKTDHVYKFSLQLYPLSDGNEKS